jgi:glycosyltransferase involved in cell wall biosynthesis
MKIMMICKYPPIQGGVSKDCYGLAFMFADMGHEVTVISNAFEVEPAYRLSMDENDKEMLQGKKGKGTVKLLSTYADDRHIYIPQNNPSVSKLVGLALQEIELSPPDLIFSRYIEPYGVAAMTVSLLSGIPYIFRHAGSDIGRLMLTEQLYPTYLQVLKRATLVMTSEHTFGRLLSLGIPPDKLVVAKTSCIDPSFFLPPEDNLKDNITFTIGVYGKPGIQKGTLPLLKAIKELSDQGLRVHLRAHWNGRNLTETQEYINELALADVVTLQPFIPNWKIPDFIHGCDLVVFLENNFKIKSHGSNIPAEVLACGRPLLTTKEIANCARYKGLLHDGENCLIVDNPDSIEYLCEKIKQALNKELRDKLVKNGLNGADVNFAYERTRESMAILLDSVNLSHMTDDESLFQSRSRKIAGIFPKSSLFFKEICENLIDSYCLENIEVLEIRQEHDAFLSYALKFLDKSPVLPNKAFICELLELESSLFKATYTLIPEEAFNNINDRVKRERMEILNDSVLQLRSGVFYGEYSYDLSQILNLSSRDAKDIPVEDTALLVRRKAGESSASIFKIPQSLVIILSFFGEDISMLDLSSLMIAKGYIKGLDDGFLRVIRDLYMREVIDIVG